MTPLVPALHTHKDRQTVLRGGGSDHCVTLLYPKGADHNSGHYRNLSDLWMLYNDKAAGEGFLSFFFISSYIAAHNRLGMDMMEMSSDCYSSSSAPVPSLFSCHLLHSGQGQRLMLWFNHCL